MELHTDNWQIANDILNSESYNKTGYESTFEKLQQLEEGNSVKIANKYERFWVIVEEINDDNMIGIVNSILLEGTPYTINSKVVFKKEHIIQIHQAEDKEKLIEDVQNTYNKFLEFLKSKNLKIDDENVLYSMFYKYCNLQSICSND